MNISADIPDSTRGIEDTYPLSPLQQGLLFNALLEPGSGVDIEQLICELHETLDVAAFRRAWRRVIARHPVLRTNLRWENLEEPRQEVLAGVELPWTEQDWRDCTVGERNRRVEDYLSADRLRGFDLARAPLFRLALLRLEVAEYHFIWTFHHSVLEGRSYRLLLQEVFLFYEAYCRGEDITPPVPRPYRDYIAWLRKLDFSQDETFWRQALKGFTRPTPLVVDHSPDIREDATPGHRSQEIQLAPQVTSALRTLAKESSLNLNTIVQGAWALLLSRYSGEADIVFGVIRSNRRFTIEGAEAMIGLFLNTLPLRVRVNADAELLPWLREVRRQWMAMHGHEHTPLAKVQGWSEVAGGNPLFQSTMMFENYHLNTLLRQQGGAWSNRRFRLLLQTSFPLGLSAFDGTELILRIDFDHRRIDGAAIAGMLGHLRTLLEAFVIDPRQKLSDLPLLTTAERQQLLIEWNRTTADYPRNLCIHELFEAQVERTPQAIAVLFEDRHLTYRELNQLSNQLACYLRNLGVGPEVRVGLCVERSLEMVIGLLGVIKAGGAYVPIDPAYPAERVAFMLRDSNASVVLAQQHLMETLPALKAANVVCLDARALPIAAGHADNLPRVATGDSLAYVIYTSGSTGQPKGVMIPHRAIVNHMQWMQATFPLNEQDCVLQKTGFSFDPSVWEFFAPLSAGGRLVMARPDGQQDPAYLVNTIIRQKVTILQAVPSLLRMLLDLPRFGDCTSLRHVFCGGEVMTEDIPRRFFSTLNCELHNLYGPTEAAIDSLYYSVPRNGSGKIIPIGRPVANTQAYVLDPFRQPVPVGVPGELFLGGIQVGRGYHNQPGLTAEKFLPDAFSNARGARLYKTGDNVRFLPDGNIEFIGRTDLQVKLRGYRIELGEIESMLQRHPAVRESVVVVREDAPRNQRLVAYCQSQSPSPPSVDELRDFLRQRLPAYMVPSAYVLLEAFPLTPNGKLDRNALPRPDGTSAISEKSQVAPRTSMEKALAAIWREAFKLERIDIHRSFFDLGGDSLMVVGVISEINRTLGVDIGVPEFFQNPTVEKLARVIEERRLLRKRRSEVVELRAGRANYPVYFIYAGPDEFRLAQLMNADHSIFGIDVKWPLAWRTAVADNRKSAFPSMEQLSAPFASALAAHARSSPVVLVGHSLAGLIAFEVAHQYQKLGGNVEMVVLIDTWARRPGAYQIARHNFMDCWKQPWNRLVSGGHTQSIGSRLRKSLLIAWRLLGQQMHEARAFFQEYFAQKPRSLTTLCDEEGNPLPGEIVRRLYLGIRDSYRLCPLDAPGTLFRAKSADGRREGCAPDDSLGWRDLFTRGFETIPITGDHLSMIREHNLALARELDQVLMRRWPDQREAVNIAAVLAADR